MVDVAAQLLDAPAHGVHVGVRVGPEQGRTGHPLGQGRHVVGDVHGTVPALGVHAGDLVVGDRDHGLGEPLDAVVVEGRLGDPPLPAPELALARQQAVAEEDPQGVEAEGVLAVVLGVAHEDPLDVLGLAQQVQAYRPELQLDDRPHLGRGVEVAELVAVEARRLLEPQGRGAVPRRPGGAGGQVLGGGLGGGHGGPLRSRGLLKI